MSNTSFSTPMYRTIEALPEEQTPGRLKRVGIALFSKLNRLRIGMRLALGFALILSLLVTTGGVSLLAMGNMQQRVDTILQDQYKQVEAATEIKYNVALIHQLLRSAILAAEYQGEGVVEKQIIPLRERNAKVLSNLENNPGNIALKSQYAEIGKAGAIDIANQKELFVYLNAAQLTEARSLLNSTISLSEKDYVKALSDLVEFQSNKMLQESQSISAAYASARRNILLMGALAIVLGSLTAFFIVRGLLRQLGGEPTQANLVAEKIADGDLAVKLNVKDGDRTSLMFALAVMRDKLASTVSQVRHGADTIALTSKEIASGNQDLSARTEHQASSLEETAASMEELTGTVAQNAASARQATQLAIQATEVAQQGGAIVGRVVDTMSAITSSSKKIVDIIAVIDGIAFQTNILALNAAVEAAHAGEQGRGFAVVATEVRNLAQRSAVAAKDIKSLIADSVDQVSIGSSLVDQAGLTMTQVVASVQKFSDIMHEIESATDEQSAGIGQVNQAIIAMDKVTQQNAAVVEELAAAAETMRDQAGQLAQVVSVFRI